MKRDYSEYCLKQREKLIRIKPETEIEKTDIYSCRAVLKLLSGNVSDEVQGFIKTTALYMDKPLPDGRDPKGEVDFAATRLIVALYGAYDNLDDEAKTLIKRFFLERDFTSKYGSENHVFMMRVARYLAAQFYDEDFKQFGMTAEEVLKTDKKYITEFILFRAKYGIGEFTSAYLLEDMFMCALLKEYVKDEELNRTVSMALDLVFIEALNNLDPHGYLAGAAGRTYFFDTVGAHTTEEIKRMFVDMELKDEKSRTVFETVGLIKYEPDEFIASAFENRHYPCEVRERKHLHSMYAWRKDTPDWAHIQKLLNAGGISKYTYLSPEYGIGAICRQDSYPVDESEDYVYAHHQQVEWSLVISGKTGEESTRLYTSHPGDSDQHREWTGDLKCCCSKAYANYNTALTVYDIEKEGEREYTHIFFEKEKYDRTVFENNRIYLQKGNVNVFVFTANPYVLNEEKCEIRADGRKNAYVFRVETDTDFDEFTEKYRNMPVIFDRENIRLEFDGLFLDKEGNGKTDSPEEYPYGYMYKSDWVEAEWGEGVVKVKNNGQTLVLDFVNNRKYIL